MLTVVSGKERGRVEGSRVRLRRGRGHRLDGLVAGEPDTRDRLVDASRAFSILVVLVWHWVLSVTSRSDDGVLVMPNPIDAVPGAVTLTWLLQVMPVFFLVAGYSGYASWRSAQRRGEPAAAYVRRRLRKVLLPAVVWAAIWLFAELAAAARPGRHRWVWEWFPGYLAPLWFLGTYAALVAATPITGRVQQRYGGWAAVLLAGLVALAGLTGPGPAGAAAVWLTAALVWLLIWQLGHVWRDWRSRGLGPEHGWALAGAGLLALVLLTGPGGYPRSMVATTTGEGSNMFPTTPAIAALAVLQLGLLLLLAPGADRLLANPRAWRPVVAINAAAVTIFVWHMTAYLVVLWVYEGLGGSLLAAPDASWWGQRLLWLLAPAAVLTSVVAIFGRVERAVRQGEHIRPAARASTRAARR